MKKLDIKQMSEKINSLSATEAESYIEELEEEVLQESNVWFSPNHELEVYLYGYYVTKDAYQISEVPFHLFYADLAKKWLAEGVSEKKLSQTEVVDEQETDYGQKAMQAYTAALTYNPVDVEILTELATLYRTQKNWESMLGTAQRMYPFIFTRKDMAVYYRFLGTYYLEIYKPELSEMVYAYSKLFYKSEQADADIHYLEEAMDRPMKQLNPQEMQQELQNASIPVQPKNETLGILYHTAKKSLEDDNTEYAKQLFTCLYQLTQDPEVENILRELL